MWNEDIRPVPLNMGRLITSAQTGAVLDLSERETFAASPDVGRSTRCA